MSGVEAGGSRFVAMEEAPLGQVFEVGEGFGDGEAHFVLAEAVIVEDGIGDFEGSRPAVAMNAVLRGGIHGLDALGVMCLEFGDTSLPVDDGSIVAGESEVHFELGQRRKRVQIGSGWLVVANADVRRYALEDLVAAKEQASAAL